MVKIAVVGTGSIGLEHIKAIEQIAELSLCAVCDIDEKKAREIGRNYGVPYFTDYHDIPGNIEIDAVILNLPHGLHCESTIFFSTVGLMSLLKSRWRILHMNVN